MTTTRGALILAARGRPAVVETVLNEQLQRLARFIDTGKPIN